MDIVLSHKISLVAELAGTSATAKSVILFHSLQPGHDDRAWHISWNPAKPLLATCSADKSVRLYSYTAGSFSQFFATYVHPNWTHKNRARYCVVSVRFDARYRIIRCQYWYLEA
jgi:WD40 repeat protein